MKHFNGSRWPDTAYTWLGANANERSPKKRKKEKTSETINNTIPIVSFFVLEECGEE